jgi:hypothetical protein
LGGLLLVIDPSARNFRNTSGNIFRPGLFERKDTAATPLRPAISVMNCDGLPLILLLPHPRIFFSMVTPWSRGFRDE